MFEVGKRYRSLIGNEYECTAVGHQLSLLVLNDGKEYSVPNSNFDKFTEIRPKRRIEAWVNVYDRNGKIEFGVFTYNSKEDATSVHGCAIIDTIKIEYEEK